MFHLLLDQVVVVLLGARLLSAHDRIALLFEGGLGSLVSLSLLLVNNQLIINPHLSSFFVSLV